MDCVIEWRNQIQATSPVAAFLDRIHGHAQSRRDDGGCATGHQVLDVLQELSRRELDLVLDAPQRGDGHDTRSRALIRARYRAPRLRSQIRQTLIPCLLMCVFSGVYSCLLTQWVRCPPRLSITTGAT